MRNQIVKRELLDNETVSNGIRLIWKSNVLHARKYIFQYIIVWYIFNIDHVCSVVQDILHKTSSGK